MFAQIHRKAAIGLAAALTLTASAASTSAAVVSYTDFNAFQSATNSLTTDSFDAAPWSSVGTKPQGTTNLGVSWTAANELFATNATSHTPSFAISSNDGTLGGTDIWDWIEAVLPDNTTAVGGWITSWRQLHNIELRAYDALDNLLGSVSVGGTGDGYAFLGLTTDSDIAKVRFMSTNVTNPVGDDLALDDFSFGAAAASIPVPEPAAMTLFGAGALAFLLRRRRRGAAHAELAAIDRRLLADIGIGRGEAVSAAPEFGIEKLRRAPHI